MVNYSASKGAWKSIKDGFATAVTLGIAFTVAGATQAATQCPELSFTAFGTAIGIKTILQFLNNYRKHRE